MTNLNCNLILRQIAVFTSQMINCAKNVVWRNSWKCEVTVILTSNQHWKWHWANNINHKPIPFRYSGNFLVLIQSIFSVELSNLSQTPYYSSWIQGITNITFFRSVRRRMNFRVEEVEEVDITSIYKNTSHHRLSIHF